jgi:NitT/TauT family transport system substrate-binding protein
MKPAAKIIFLIFAVAILGGGFNLWRSRGHEGTLVEKITGKAAGGVSTIALGSDQGKLGRPLRVAINQWPGFSPGLVSNNGLAANKNSMNWKDQNLLVEYVVMDDPIAMTKAYASGDIDVIWSTIDSAATQLGGLKKGGAPTKVFMQVDWSRGGDAIVAARGINSIEDLKGKTVALITQSPSEFLLQYGLRNSSLDETEQKAILSRMVGNDTPDQVIAAFAAGKVDAIVTWEPNISAVLQSASDRGAHVILSTSTISNAVGDVFMARSEFVQQHPDVIGSFAKSWFSGAREVNRNTQGAVDLMMANMPQFKQLGRNKTLDTFAQVKITDMSDNTKTFGLNGNAPLYDKIFNDATEMYASRGVLDSRISASESKDAGVLQTYYATLTPEDQKAAPKEEFKFPAKQREVAKNASPAFTKQITITFATNSAELTSGAKASLDKNVVGIAEIASNAFLRVEGNTDSQGNTDSNVGLSQRRAQAVVNYLASKGFDSGRLIPVGNGPNHPVASNGTSEGRARNRRTDIKVIAK